MRVIRMNPRSRYHKISCLHCHRKVAKGRVAVASTYYVLVNPKLEDGKRVWISTQSRVAWRRRHGQNVLDGFSELMIRVVYHRACLEKILDGAPQDPEKVASRFEVYRGELAEEFEELPSWLLR